MAEIEDIIEPFKRSSKTIQEIDSIRHKRQNSYMKFGITYLDDLLSGIFCDDLVVIISKAGYGKTSLCVNITNNLIRQLKKVYYIALEATYGEIELRLKYGYLSNAYFQARKETLFYHDYYIGKEIDKTIDKNVTDELNKYLQTLNVRYRKDGDYGLQELQRDIISNKNDADIFIIDHLHYFDLEGFNENKEIKEIMKKIRDMVLLYNKPIILVCHIKKSDSRVFKLVPEMDDIHGSSDIAKIATKIISIAPAFDIEQDRYETLIYPTYFKILKNRNNGSVIRHLGLLKYNISKTLYEPAYKIGKEKNGKFEEYTNNQRR